VEGWGGGGWREMFGGYRYQMRTAEIFKELNVFTLMRKNEKKKKRNCFSADK
jgi:hypothetical protein